MYNKLKIVNVLLYFLSLVLLCLFLSWLSGSRLSGFSVDDVHDCFGASVSESLLVTVDSSQLETSDGSEEEVDGRQEIVLWLDDHAPTSPDGTGSEEGDLLGTRDFLHGSLKVVNTGDNKGPLQVATVSTNVQIILSMIAIPSSQEPRGS